MTGSSPLSEKLSRKDFISDRLAGKKEKLSRNRGNYDRLEGEPEKAVKKTSECRQIYMVKPDTCHKWTPKKLNPTILVK
jgi:hypothetical protein